MTKNTVQKIGNFRHEVPHGRKCLVPGGGSQDTPARRGVEGTPPRRAKPTLTEYPGHASAAALALGKGGAGRGLKEVANPKNNTKKSAITSLRDAPDLCSWLVVSLHQVMGPLRCTGRRKPEIKQWLTIRILLIDLNENFNWFGFLHPLPESLSPK